MKNITQFIKGWVIGDFEPNILRTKDFEFGVKYNKSGDTEKAHYHKVATEYTIVVSGIHIINGVIYRTGDICIIKPNEVCRYQCGRSGSLAIVKVPSVKGDKYEV